MNMIWLRFDASSFPPSQFLACFVIPPLATIKA